MYQAYWGLAKSPFRGHLDPESFYQGPSQEEALARLHFLVDERRTLGLLLGESGSGKSLLLEVFGKELGIVQRQHALISLVGTTRGELLWLLAGQLGAESLHSAREFQLCRAIDDQILANRYQQISTVLMFDDADEAHGDVLDEVTRLTQFNQAHDAGLTLVLTGRAERLHRLGTRLLELAELRVDLDGWDEDDTAAFVKQSLAKAGRSTPIFTAAALRRLHELSGGIPRRVKQLADLALVGGAGSNLASIEADLIDAVYQELGVDTSQPTIATLR